MSPVSPGGDPRISFRFGKFRGRPLLLLGEFGQVSKIQRKWNITIDNPKGASVEFVGDAGADKNKLLKGHWTFLHKSKENEGKLFEVGSFDMAVPKKNSFSTYGGPNLLTNTARLLFCKQSSKSSEQNMVKTKTEGSGGTIFCRDITKSWYFGFIRGEHYGATFAVKPKGVLKEEFRKNDISTLKHLSTENKGIIHETLLEILKLATDTKDTFDGKVKSVNERTGQYGNARYQNHWCGENNCFQWGTIGSKKGENEQAKNCGVSNEDFKGCDIGIIDVSRDFLFTFKTLGGCPVLFFLKSSY